MPGAVISIQAFAVNRLLNDGKGLMKLAAAFLLGAFTGISGISASSQTAAAPTETLRKIEPIQLSGKISGPFDHLGIDLKNKRLFATPENYHAVLVMDMETGKVIHELPVAKPHAVLYRDDLDRIYVTDGEDGSLKIFDGKTYELRKRIALKTDADSIGYDSIYGLLYVVSGGRDAGQKFSTLSVIDLAEEKKLADIEIDGDTLEAMVLDTYRPRLYINNAAKNEIDVVDRWTRKVIAEWPVTLGKRNVAMALDEPHQRLFAASRDGKVVVFDTNTGKELQAVPITAGVDDLAYDAASARLYAIGNGVVDVIGQVDADHYKALGRSDAGPLARNALLVPEINRYFAAVPQSASAAASIAVFETVDVPARKPAQVSDAEPLTAPFAGRLVLSMLSSHPDLRKMGLHAVPPGRTTSVIVANGNKSRVGVPTTQGDFDAVKEGKTYCSAKQNGAFYNLKMPLFDAMGNRIGILVMEIPFTSAVDEADAIRKAEAIRAEVAQKIPDLKSLFGE
jgi:DNA-binding beta-propeller fold protein YncE